MGSAPVVTEVGPDEARTTRDQKSFHRGAPESVRTVSVSRNAHRQCNAVMPSSRSVSCLSSSPYAGRQATVGYSALVIGSIAGVELSRPSVAASSPMATAKSYQLATPESHQWYRPGALRRASAQRTCARPVTLVGAPI